LLTTPIKFVIFAYWRFINKLIKILL
jgi:hypothetical protein